MGLKEAIIHLVGGEVPLPPNLSKDIFYAAPTDITLGTKIVVTTDANAPIGTRTTPEVKRISKDELEACYVLEPVVFNGINKVTQLIIAAGYSLVGDERSVKFFENFFNEVGLRGGEIEWEEILATIIKHQVMFGPAWIELIPAKRNPNKIVDLQYLDPKQMDYAKDKYEHIVLDSSGNPVGYVQTLPYDYVVEGGDIPPQSVSLQSNQIFFKPQRIAHYKLYNTGDGFYPVGLIEPAYKSILRKIHLEEAHANSFKKNGFPRLEVTIGDEEHNPTEEQIQRALEKIKNMDNMGVFGHPNWVKLNLLESKAFENLQEQLNYYNYQIVTAMGLPMALVTGMGDSTNRSTLNRQESITKFTLKDIIKRTIMVTEKQIIEPIAKSNGVNPVKIKWGELMIEEMDGKSRRLSGYAKNGLLTPDDTIENIIRTSEDLPKMDPNAKPRVMPQQNNSFGGKKKKSSKDEEDEDDDEDGE
jgi:hypothetical protein